jgi:hypothetical protein
MRIAIIPITTKSSTSVNPERRREDEGMAFDSRGLTHGRAGEIKFAARPQTEHGLISTSGTKDGLYTMPETRKIRRAPLTQSNRMVKKNGGIVM